jgi:filamentous hemagglutinin family protein
METSTIQRFISKNWTRWLLNSVSITLIMPFFDDLALGQQLQPDTTLGAESTIVNSGIIINDIPSDFIIGGAVRGANLFHSFEEFNIGEGHGIYFNNPNGIDRIICRVTGSGLSKISGTLGVFGGSADLFLLNPNGIIFGSNASLDLRGSFLASTASSYVFSDAEYSAVKPFSASPLSINVPIGLQFRNMPGAIINESQVVDSSSQLLVGLQVQPGKTLALVGGDITMEGGILTAPGGRVELGSISGSGQVKLEENNWALGYKSISNQDFGNITLKSGSIIVSRDEDGGDIFLRGKNVTIADGSRVGTLVTGSKPGGTLNITASDSFVLTGLYSGLVNTSFGTGDSGNIVINAKQVFLSDGAYIQTASTSQEPTPGVIVSSSGQSGNVSITTTRMQISGGAYINASTEGVGEGGNILINSSDYVKISGISLDNGRPSILFTSSEVGSSGQAGNINVNTNYLKVSDGAAISVSSEGTGAAGNLEINAQSIQLENQGLLSAQTTSGLGNIALNANDIVLRGNSRISTNASGTASGGNIAVNTGVLVGFENSDIVANAFTGSGGRVEISAKGIFGLVPRTRVEIEQLLGTTDPRQLDPGLLPSSDITAISQSNPSLNGQVILNTPDVDPSKGLLELPTTVVDPNALVAQNPCKRGSESEFTRSGRGGLPPSLSQDFDSDATQVGLVAPVQTSTADKQQAKTLEGKTGSLASVSNPIVPAQGWVFNDKGEVVLVADNSAIAPQRLKANPAGCPVR